jgi:hypothetical protein
MDENPFEAGRSPKETVIDNPTNIPRSVRWEEPILHKVYAGQDSIRSPKNY